MSWTFSAITKARDEGRVLNAMEVAEKRWDEQGKVETLMCNVDDRCKLKKRSACNTSGWDRAARQG